MINVHCCMPFSLTRSKFYGFRPLAIWLYSIPDSSSLQLQCIPGLKDDFGNDQLFCDCSEAMDDEGNPFVGKFCEIPSRDNCGTEQDDLFCVNGGSCNLVVGDDTNFCECPSGFQGPHCEYEEGSVPECSLVCQNDGECQFGVPPALAQFHDLDHLYLHDGTASQDSMYCVCTASFGGKFCDIPMTLCGSAQCYNGGTCIAQEDGA